MKLKKFANIVSFRAACENLGILWSEDASAGITCGYDEDAVLSAEWEGPDGVQYEVPRHVADEFHAHGFHIKADGSVWTMVEP